MDKTVDRETRDFMNVESFSQLPFIRPAPPKDKHLTGGGAIRLFGKEFGVLDDDEQDTQEELDGGKEREKDMSSSRKFECHYCCRNFPTSQALGGHQNAHKRERQQAKRAHLQSAMAADSHIYGLINYTRFGSSSSSAPPLPMPMPYNNLHYSWNHANRQLYHHHQPQPINGSPLALWRLPPAPSARVDHRPFYTASKDESSLTSSTSNISTSQFRFGGYESKPQNNSNNIHEHVSLDLHL